jgi:hypothetical protein
VRWENPPEGASNLQECSRSTKGHFLPVGITGIHKNWKKALKGMEEYSLPSEIKREREGKREQMILTGEGSTSIGGRRRIAVGEGRSPVREEIARDREQRQRTAKRNCQASGARGERFFKNRIWAHRTVYNACPVHTGQRTVAVR